MKSRSLLFRFVSLNMIVAFLTAGVSLLSSFLLMIREVRMQEARARQIAVNATAQRLNELFETASSFVNTASHNEAFLHLCNSDLNDLSYSQYAAGYKKSMESTLHNLEGISSILNIFPSGYTLPLDVSGQVRTDSLTTEYYNLVQNIPDLTGISLVLPSNPDLPVIGLSMPYATAVNESPASVFLFLLDGDYLTSLSGSMFEYTLIDSEQTSWSSQNEAVQTAPYFERQFMDEKSDVYEQALLIEGLRIVCKFPSSSAFPCIRPWLFVLILPYVAVCGVLCRSYIRRRLQPLYHLEETINRQQIPSSCTPIDNRRHTLSLSYALFVILSSTALLSTVFFSFMNYKVNENAIQSAIYQVHERSFHLVCDNISHLLQQYQDLLLQTSVEPYIQNALSSRNTEALNQLLADSDHPTPELHNVSLFTGEDQLFYSTAYVMNYLTDETMAQDLRRARTNYGERIWRYNAYSSSNSGEIRIGMLVIGSNSSFPGAGNRLGTIWMDFGDENIRSFLSGLVEDDCFYSVSDEDDVLLFSSSGLEMADELSLRLEYPVLVNQWNIRLYMPNTLIRTELKTFWRYAVGILLAVCLCLLALCTMLERRLLHSVRRLAKSMTELEPCPFISRNFLPKQNADEITTICMSYNQMLERLSRTIQKNLEMERKSRQFEINMLQAQINPHFLYNTLRTAQVLIVRNDPNAITLIDKLIVLFRSAAQSVPAAITLNEECQQCKAYLDIQTLRFSGRILASVEIPEPYLDTPILRFSLQPIVENVFQHGQISSDGRIEICAQEENHALAIRIQDNGAGMTGDELLRWNQKLQGDSEYESHIGILNVHQRTRLFFGPEYGISLEAAPGRGLVVVLRVPLRK